MKKTYLFYLFKYGFTILFLISAITAFAQNAYVSGKVVDEKNQPLPGASVTIGGTTLGATTDVDGNFRINDVKPGTYTLTANFIGYNIIKKTITVSGSANVQANFQMQPTAQSLNEVVVVGYGTVRKSDVTGAVTNLGSKDLNPGPITNPLQQIAGKAAGVNISQVGSEPGTAPSVVLLLYKVAMIL